LTPAVAAAWAADAVAASDILLACNSFDDVKRAR